VLVFQCLNCTLVINRSPRGAWPRSLVMFVFVPSISFGAQPSRKTSRRGSSFDINSLHDFLASAMSARSYSAATIDFFACQPKLPQSAAQVRHADRNAQRMPDPVLQLRQGLVGLLGDTSPQSVIMAS